MFAQVFLLIRQVGSLVGGAGEEGEGLPGETRGLKETEVWARVRPRLPAGPEVEIVGFEGVGRGGCA